MRETCGTEGCPICAVTRRGPVRDALNLLYLAATETVWAVTTVVGRFIGGLRRGR